MNTTEQLAVLTAMEKAVKDRIKEVRKEADASLLDAYDSAGFEKMAVKLNGQKVGEHIITFHSDGFTITDREAFTEFALDYGLMTQKRTIAPDFMESAINALQDAFDPEVLDGAIITECELSPDWEKALERAGDAVVFMDSGLIVPGVEYRPKQVKGTMVRGCKPAEVLPILAALPEGVEQLLLGGAE